MSLHVSTVHALPSSQLVTLRNWQPSSGSQYQVPRHGVVVQSESCRQWSGGRGMQPIAARQIWPELHSAFCGTWSHVRPSRHVSSVHGIESLHCESIVHGVGACPQPTPTMH
jgi:hypothetical protein